MSSSYLDSWWILAIVIPYCGYFLCLAFYSLHFDGAERFDAWFYPYIPRFIMAVSSLPPPEPSYSLWLSPSLSEQGTSTISSLIAHLPGPKFPPHATLLGEVPLETKLEDLLKSIEGAVKKTFDGGEKNVGSRGKGLEVEFEDVRTGVEFFRCVLVKLKETPLLLALHQNLLLALPSPTERKPFYPHISLLYSNIAVPEREKIVAKLYDEGLARSLGDGGGLELFAPGEKEKGGVAGEGVKGVRCDRVSVVRTKGLKVEDWVVVGEVKI